MISIILTTYNRCDRLKRAIESVLHQTYKEWELIVIDDHSTDGTQELLEEYTKRYPQIHAERLVKNFGNDTHPKNVGTRRSKGDWLCYLDDDNEWLADHLMVLVKATQTDPAIAIWYGDRMVYSDDPEIKQEPMIGIHSEYSQPLLFEQNYIDTTDALINREAIFAVGGWDERYKKFIDWNLWIRLTKAGYRFKRVAKVISKYYIHQGQKSIQVEQSKKVGKLPFGSEYLDNPFKPKWDPFELEIELPYLGDRPLPRVAVFTLTKDRLDYTKVMYESLKKAGYSLTWFVIDQGSTDGTVKWLKSLKGDIRVTPLPKNIGISKGSNLALDTIGKDFDYIIKIDNDCEVLTDDWLKRLLYIYQAHRKIILSPYVEGLIDNPGGAPRIMYKTVRDHFLGITSHIGGIFTMAHQSAYDGFRWDEDDFLHGMQDTVFCQEMQKRDFLIAYVEDIRCAHIDSTDGQKKKYPEYFTLRRKEKITVA